MKAVPGKHGHWKLARELCDRFEYIYLETLNLAGMKRLWGRKASDLGFDEFVEILKQVAAKTGVEIVQIDRWEPTSKACVNCGARQSMPLSVRHFHCPECGWSVSRDQNAAVNIVAVGASAAGLGGVRRQLIVAISA